MVKDPSPQWWEDSITLGAVERSIIEPRLAAFRGRAGVDAREVREARNRLLATFSSSTAVLLPPAAYALSIGGARGCTWVRVAALLVVAATVFATAGFLTREHDAVKHLRPAQRRGPAGLCRRATEPAYGWRVRRQNVGLASSFILALLIVGVVWASIVNGTPDWFQADVAVRRVNKDAFDVLIGLIPTILLILVIDQQLALVRPVWRRGWSLVLVATVFGGLIVAEVVAIAMRVSDSPAVWGFPVVTGIVAVSLTVLTFGLGWRIWDRYPTDVPRPNQLEKFVFWFVGQVTLALVCFMNAYAILVAQP